jgi:hypothetical protein
LLGTLSVCRFDCTSECGFSHFISQKKNLLLFPIKEPKQTHFMFNLITMGECKTKSIKYTKVDFFKVIRGTVKNNSAFPV